MYPSTGPGKYQAHDFNSLLISSVLKSLSANYIFLLMSSSKGRYMASSSFCEQDMYKVQTQAEISCKAVFIGAFHSFVYSLG